MSTEIAKKTKRPRTLGRYSKEQHDEAELRRWPLVHVEVNDAYMEDADGSNISIHGPASSKFAAAIRELMWSYNKGFFDDQHGEFPDCGCIVPADCPRGC